MLTACNVGAETGTPDQVVNPAGQLPVLDLRRVDAPCENQQLLAYVSAAAERVGLSNG